MYQIYNEDCLSGMERIPDGAIGFALIDPPFSITDSRWDKPLDWAQFWVELKRILAPCSSAAMFASSKFTFELYATNPEMYRYKWYWVKNTPTNFINAHNRPMNTLEEILVFSNGVVAHEGKSKRRMKYFPQGLTTYEPRERVNYSKKTVPTSPVFADSVYRIWNTQRRIGGYSSHYVQEYTGYPNDVLKFDALPSFQKVHPNQKPVDLLAYLIRTYTNEGETVLDATMGSGSTGVACVNTGRNFIGFETERKFFEVAQKRIDEAVAAQGQSLF